MRKKKKKIEKTHAKENNHTHKTIFTWFGNLHPQSCRDFTIIREEYKLQLQYFLSIKKHGNNTHYKTLITKVGFTIG